MQSELSDVQVGYCELRQAWFILYSYIYLYVCVCVCVRVGE